MCCLLNSVLITCNQKIISFKQLSLLHLGYNQLKPTHTYIMYFISASCNTLNQETIITITHTKIIKIVCDYYNDLEVQPEQ